MMRQYLFSFFSICLLIFGLSACRSANYLAQIEANKQTLSDSVPADSSILAMIQPYKIKLDEQMNQVIGETSVVLTKRRPESTLGNWMADAIQRQTEKHLGKPVAFAIQNYGGIRIPQISKGSITRGKIYELMPFDNTVVVMSLNKAEVMELMNHIVDGGGWPISSNVKINQLEGGKLEVLINKEKLSDTQLYTVAIPDYVANGGSRSYFLKDKPRQELSIFIRDALIADVEAHTANNQTITSKIEGRIVLIN
ncbi:MAG: 5'-nucleotidase [Bacteroidota bacterium]